MNETQIVNENSILDVTTVETGRLIPPGKHLARQSTAALYRCQECQVWWGGSQGHSLLDYRVFCLAEPNTDLFLWQDYRGWRNGTEPDSCPECGGKEIGPAHSF